MTAQLILRIVGFFTSGLILLVGIVVLAGFLLPDYIPSNYRITFGIVLVIYGTYRMIMIAMKLRNERRVQHQ